MPIYAYKCTACGYAKEAQQKIFAAPLTVCPECGASTFHKEVRLLQRAFSSKALTGMQLISKTALVATSPNPQKEQLPQARPMTPPPMQTAQAQVRRPKQALRQKLIETTKRTRLDKSLVG